MMPNQDSQCPYCKHDFGKPVKGKRICPACKNTIVIRGGLPVTEAKAQTIDGKREAARDAKYLRECKQIQREALAATKRDLRQWKQMGITTVVLRNSADCCDECRSLNGTFYPVNDATIADPPIPVKICTGDFCRCHLTVPDGVLEGMIHESDKKIGQLLRQAPLAATRRSGCLVYLLTGIALTALALCTFIHW